ncbi:hypothetical protein TEA_027602 [Camellia sinensis var. sinensis]|uniref:MLO-like protein n=1 Tax=Camellia sinensis var. sinensis TaxID=542762 RepID=A0A4S4DEF3_CAMSN|nr:hypothetical protein TEA_027602 [Camellia sinensis var. sinensis]
MSGHGEGTTLEYTPTFVVAGVCTVIVGISLAYLKKKDLKSLYEALQKVKEELMLLGFISLLLTVLQSSITKICVKEGLTHHFLPCKLVSEGGESSSNSTGATSHYQRLLAEATSGTGYCAGKKMVPLLSVEALHHLHVFIFVLGFVHVTCTVLTVVIGTAKIRQWKHWEDSIAKVNYDTGQVLKPKLTDVHQHAFIKGRFLGFGKNSAILGWLTHCRGNPKFNFHKYMIRALEDDFKKVVGWHTYFWIAFVPLILLLAVGTKLEHVITQLAHEVAEKHIAIEGELVVQPSDNHFWFHRPPIVLFLIHFILFQNAFEIAFFFWIWLQYGFDSCIMGHVRFIIPRLIIGVFVQVLCSYSTLPLYAIVTQMGSSFKKAIFDDHVQKGLVGWAEKAKMKKHLKTATNGSGQGSSTAASIMGVQMGRVAGKGSAPEEIQPTAGS